MGPLLLPDAGPLLNDELRLPLLLALDSPLANAKLRWRSTLAEIRIEFERCNPRTVSRGTNFFLPSAVYCRSRALGDRFKSPGLRLVEFGLLGLPAEASTKDLFNPDEEETIDLVGSFPAPPANTILMQKKRKRPLNYTLTNDILIAQLVELSVMFDLLRAHLALRHGL
jgi:hypothetical protein